MTNEKPCKYSGRATNSAGYAKLAKYKYGYNYEHRYVYAKFHRVKLTSRDVVRHICDHPACIEITHLELGTHKDNSDDKIKRGRDKHTRGEDHPTSVLTEEDVKNIRDMAWNGYSNRAIAREYNVSHSTIDDIINGKWWKGVE